MYSGCEGTGRDGMASAGSPGRPLPACGEAPPPRRPPGEKAVAPRVLPSVLVPKPRQELDSRLPLEVALKPVR